MISRILRVFRSKGGCHGPADATTRKSDRTLVLVGSPNVGKSLMFGNLTGSYVTVSNYPGTTVEVARGVGVIGGERYQVVDTPGMYSFLPISEEERVARRVLMQEGLDAVVHVADAKSVERSLLLTFALIETGLPVILAVNMLDEAEGAGLRIDLRELEHELGIPVVGTVSTTAAGMDELRRRISGGDLAPPVDRFRYGSPRGVPIEILITRVQALLTGEYPVSKRSVAIALLQDDEEAQEMVRQVKPEVLEAIPRIKQEAGAADGQPLDYLITLERNKWARAIHSRVVRGGEAAPPTFAEKLGRALVRPWIGFPVLVLVLYLGLYKVVGQFGAGVLVDFLEGTVFEGLVSPRLEEAAKVIPWQPIRDLFVGEYGLLTLGLRYAVAIILPIVTLFFLVFAFIEDVGYLPRLASLLDRAFKKMGLSGRAVIPMVLGLACDTMATMVTRTLSTKRERLIAIILLSVAVPCSAQLGVIIALLSSVPGALLVWSLTIGVVYVSVGTAAARLIPGRAAPFYVEIPPMRLPGISNILIKTFARVKWYLKEVIPLFMLASVLMWLGNLTGLFQVAIGVLERPVGWIGMPAKTAKVFLFGFFRRDYGAAGLYDQAGELTGAQLVVGAIALTLFLPCIAHFLMTVRERGVRTGVAIAAATLAISFGVAFVVFRVLDVLSVMQ